MESLVAIGIDVHKEKFALVAILLVLGAQDQILGEIEVGSDYKEILAFIESIKQKALPGQTYSLYAVTRQAAWGMSFITSSLQPESGVSSWLLPQCSQSRGNASRPTGAMPG